MARIVFVAALMIALAITASAQTIPLPGGRTADAIVSEAAEARAAAILLVGGKGTISAGSKNFLARTQALMAEAAITTALVGVPSGERELSAEFRISQAHADDLSAAVDWLRERYGLPVWVIGTSRGTISAVNLFARKGPVAEGLVLSASVTAPRWGSELADAGKKGVLDRLDELPPVPVLVLHHRDDACEVTPPDGAAEIFERLDEAPRRVLKFVEGGEGGLGNPCRASTYHGFLGVEREAVAAIAGFILDE